MDHLVVTTVSLGVKQLDYIKRQCDNVSRYIRSLIDREMGAEQVRTVEKSSCYIVNNDLIESPEKQKTASKPAVWNFPK